MENINKSEVLTKLMFRKPIHILVALADGKHKSQLSRECDMTYSHCVKQVAVLEKAGVLKTIKDGRKSVIKLTDYGVELRDAAYLIMEKIGKA